jgi:hypothetical protein
MNVRPHELPLLLARRAFLRRSGMGLGAMALSSLGERATAQDPARARRLPDFAPRAKRIVWLYMAGGMTHLDTFDDKPELRRRDGEPMPESLTKGQQIAQLQGQALRILAPQHPFVRRGRSGQSMASIWPRLGQCADDLCIVRSLHTDAINHDPAHTFMNTGTMNQGRPAMGSWLSYGLGAEASDLPAFVVMVSTGAFGQKQPIAARQWHSGFLPGQHQGVLFRGGGEPVLYAQSPAGVDGARQRDVVDAVRRLDGLAEARLGDPEIGARLRQYELAFRMQASVPELTDLRGEPQGVLDMYGATPGDGSFASNCLLARRLLERGVRFVQLYHRDWDHHGAVKEHSAGTAREVDQGAAALLTDLKQRGMLDDTIVVFGSEFGRTPMAQGDGRDHHMQAFTMWFAGGGFRAGHAHGATDDFGYRAVQDRVSVHDVHATLLHQLGIDHERFTFRHQGLDDRLTGVEPAKVARALLA